ncbi:thioredoxin family protein [Flavobacterium lindanitolerans]|uniref:thioredoxin family protein n=1 Tax=Flavobacterium lindanitolerans TaxID=428988 RepID=UPI00280752AB|nr:thioredoxin family protein [Flavobacterium lindanitolerans]MDQ7961565.1 thioredoxin family protein [Flavobacterium lindanitolerans]
MKKLLLLLLLATSLPGFSQKWNTSLSEAKTIASKENKPILLVFSGSDWCAPCIKLEKNVWLSEEFKKEANVGWVLVKADFPKKKNNQQSEEQKTQNKTLAEKYNKEGFFPLVVVLDKTGKVLGKTGYENIKASEYISLIKSFISR